MHNKALFSIILLAVSALSACGTPKGPLYAEGEIVGEMVAANMDSEIAKNTLEPAADEPIELRQHRQQLEQTINAIPDAAELQHLVKQGSPDFASVVFARALLGQPYNKRWQMRSRRLSEQLGAKETKLQLQKVFTKHHALLVPGWHWKTRTDTGADLSFQRRILASFGLQSTLIETDEHGSVEKNGALIAQAIKDASVLNKSIVLISASKGGADTAYALGAELDTSQTPYLKGWLNIGGIIAGSTLVDNAMNDPKRWLRRIGFAEDTPVTAIFGLNTAEAAARLTKLEFPDSVTIVNYAALAFASSVNDKSIHSYMELASYGPNDGAALIQEMLVPGGHTVLEIGLDHYMRSRRAMNRAIALLLMIMECGSESACD